MGGVGVGEMDVGRGGILPPGTADGTGQDGHVAAGSRAFWCAGEKRVRRNRMGVLCALPAQGSRSEERAEATRKGSEGCEAAAKRPEPRRARWGTQK
jgi:hypothetical protein